VITDQPRGSDEAMSVCPVCRWADEGTPLCVRCGWEMRGGYIFGSALAGEQDELTTRLAARCRHHDLRAAVRAAGSVGERDDALLARLAKLARYGPPSDLQVRDAVAEADAQEPSVPATMAGVGFALTRLVTEETSGVALIEIGPDAVSMQTLVADELGVPVRQAGDSLAWTAVLPILPRDADLRYLRMAGGVGTGHGSDRAADAGQQPGILPDLALVAEAVADTMQHVLARFTAAASAAAVGSGAVPGRPSPGDPPYRVLPRVDTVLVHRTHGWPLLEAAAAQARTTLRPVAQIVAAPGAGTLADLADLVASRAPLRYCYDLILVKVNPRTGMVRPAPHQLFAAGAAALPDDRPTVRLAVAAPVPAARRLSLPIVARRGRSEASWSLVQMAAMDGTATGTTQLQVRLEAPGQLSIQGTPHLLSPGPGTMDWPELLRQLPVQLPQSPGLDLVVLVELGGEPRIVAQRVDLARGIIDAVALGPDVRAAVVGYRDHFGKHRVDATTAQEQEALVVGCGLGPVDGTRSVFADPERWRAVPVGDDHAAPIEDALHQVARPDWGWRPGVRHVLLIVGKRPPHPPTAGPHGDVMLPCPHRYSWPDALDRLRHDQAIESITVLDDRAASAWARKHGYAEQAWREFGVQGRFTADRSTATQVARIVGLTSTNDDIQLRLAEYAGAGRHH
jgi:hypothetical protein